MAPTCVKSQTFSGSGMSVRSRFLGAVVGVLLFLTCLYGQVPATMSSYVLGQGDQVTLRVVEADEIPDKPFRIDEKGSIDVPMIGAVHAAGLTVHELQTLLVTRFTAFIKNPQVAVFVNEMRSQPVSVLGAVNLPGVHQLQGHKTLVEVLATAGGLKPDAGYSVRITRHMEWGQVPLPGSSVTPDGLYSVGEVGLKGLLEAKNPADNIAVMPNDVLTIPVAEMIYVLGDVRKSGGFVLGERKGVSVLQALAMAEGTTPLARSNEARILRNSPGSEVRAEIPVDLKKIMNGQAIDIAMQSNDVLFVPTSGVKKIRERALDAIFAIGSGVAIYRP